MEARREPPPVSRNMPVLPDFMPEGTPGEAAQALAEGRNQGESWMSMEQNRQIQAQQAQDQHNQMVAQLPIYHAKAQADVVSANAAIGLATRMQQLRTQAGAVANDANNEFLSASQLADPEAKFQALGDLSAKYAWMSLLPEYKPFTDQINAQRGEAFHMVTANNLADATLQRTQALVGGREDIASQTNDTRLQVAQTQAGERAGAAEQMAASRIEAAKIRASAPKSYELETTMKLMQDAADSGDEEGAKIYAARVAKLNHIHQTQEELAAPPAAAPAPKPKAAPAAPIKPPPTVKIDGTDYPVYRDKDGNLAYLKDGKYEPITQ